MTLEEARKLALSLPGTTEEPHFERTSYRVGGKIFATALPGGESLNVFVEEATARAVVDECPNLWNSWWGKRLVGVRILLDSANCEEVMEILGEAWAMRAGKRLVTQRKGDGRDESGAV